MSEVVVIIPAFNEELTIGRVVGRAPPHAPLVVLDDGSTDRTAEEAEQAGATVISCGSRRGKGVALRAGVEAARQSNTAWVVTLDGDGQHSPEDIPRLHRVARQAGAAIVVGVTVSREAA
jgi:glycosyltransferase involved in cell wall biosynthesis